MAPQDNGECTVPGGCMDVRSDLIMAGGQIVPILDRLLLNQKELGQVIDKISNAIHLYDIVLLVILSLLSVHIGRLFFQFFKRVANYPYEVSYTYQVASHISQASQLALVVYLVDCFVIALTTVGFPFDQLSQLSRGFAKILYIAWAAQRVSVFKRYLFSLVVQRSPDKLGRLDMVDRLADIILYICTGFILLDILDVQMGVGFTSMFAFGSAGTLMVGLATKDLAEMFVDGLMLSTTGRFHIGDEVQFGDGTCGIIHKIAWMETTIRNYDERLEVIPNSQLGMQRCKNLSRVKQCQVKETLRFKYEDADKLPKLLPDILEEIKSACPEIISDGSRPYRAVWTGYEEYYLPVLIMVHFKLPTTGTLYWENRQRVMEAIHRAVKKHEMEFAIPIYARPPSN